MGINIQTIQDIRIYLRKELAGEYPEEEIRALGNIIIRKELGIKDSHQLLLTERSVNNKEAERIKRICHELHNGKPIQYILGETEFYGCTIKLNSETLIPRQETEELADLIIKENNHFQGKIIDFGTGSGCIAIALAVNIPGAEVTGTDISEQALNIAAENAVLNNANVLFLIDDILDPKTLTRSTADIIVSNPPYVRESEKQLMKRNVLDFEPHNALFVPDSDPLRFYAAIIGKACGILVAGGRVYFEINEALGEAVANLMSESGYSGVNIVKDLNGKDRIVRGIKNG